MPVFDYVTRWFAIRQPRTPLSRALLVAQYGVLLRQAPMVYATVIIETLSITYVLPASLPWPLRFAAALVYIPLAVRRLVQWYRQKPTVEVNAETAWSLLVRARSRALWMGVSSTLWALILYQWVDEQTRILAMLLIMVGSMGSAYCLASVPAAARLNLLVSTAPLAIRLILSGETFSVCFGINLLLLLGLFVRMMNLHYADFAMRVASRVRLTAERERLRTARQVAVSEQHKIRDLAERFDTAMNNMSQGLCFFDGKQRLITCNRRYLEMYGLDPDRVGAGTTLKEIVELRYAVGSAPRMTAEQYLAWRNNVAVSTEPTDSTVELANGQVMAIRHRPMPDGGWVATHDDITEKFNAERAVTAAKADAVRAEQEARAAHQHLVDALDLVPEGLVIFDKDDRYLLWNQKYAEIFDRSRDLIVKGARFEDVLRTGIARGQYPEATDEGWVTRRLALHGQAQNRHEQELADGRWCRVEERRTENGSIGIRVDITDLKQRETMFRMLFDQNPVLMWVFDPETLRFLAVNDVAVEHYGYTREQFLEMTLLDIRPHEDWEEARSAAQAVEDAWRHRSKSWRHIRADGSEIEVETYGKTIQYHGKAAVMVALIDVTDRKRAERRIEHIALHDALTDLPNRTALDQHFSEALARGQEIGERFAVLCIDLDRFKEINDLHGHSVGDLVLCEVSRRLRAVPAAAPSSRGSAVTSSSPSCRSPTTSATPCRVSCDASKPCSMMTSRLAGTRSSSLSASASRCSRTTAPMPPR
jgi:PAS domain S-box-containing protein